jgi:hypothetical protein
VSASSSPDQRLLHHLTHAANAAGHRAHDVEREVRNFVDHEAEVRPSITDNSQASFTRAVELRGALSTIDMNQSPRSTSDSALQRAHIDVRALGLWAHGRSTTP